MCSIGVEIIIKLSRLSFGDRNNMLLSLYREMMSKTDTEVTNITIMLGSYF